MGDFPKAQQILYEQRSIITEAHLHILLQLLQLEGGETDIEILQWLAYRYAEKTQFSTAKEYFLVS